MNKTVTTEDFPLELYLSPLFSAKNGYVEPLRECTLEPKRKTGDDVEYIRADIARIWHDPKTDGFPLWNTLCGDGIIHTYAVKYMDGDILRIKTINVLDVDLLRACKWSHIEKDSIIGWMLIYTYHGEK